MSLAGTLSRCVRRRCAAVFRCGVVAALAVPPAVLPDIGAEHAAALVTMALSVSACSLCPLLVLAIWWRGLTAAGAAAGLLTGAGLTVAAAAAGLSTGPGTGGAGAVLAQPTLIAAPAVFAVMAGVSLLTRHRVPRHAGRALASMHLPESPAAPPPSAGTSVPAAGSP